MSMQPRPWPDVLDLTARMARSSSRKGNLAMRIRDELGEVYADTRFAAAFGVRGRPGISPGQLMMASVLQFSENLTDRQAAEAVRDRITWKYALGLELEDPGFDASVLSEFRSRLVAGDLTSLALDALVERLAGLGLVKAGGRQRTDSTHVLGAIRALNRLELAGETLQAALAVAAPDWMTGVIEASGQQVYGARIDNLHLPESQAKRQALMVDYGKDGYHLLEVVHGPDAPIWLRELPAVATLRRIWVQQFYREVTDGRAELRRREKLPGGTVSRRAETAPFSPHDLHARHSVTRDHGWGGYKVHVTETCDAPGTPPDIPTGADPDTTPTPDQRRGDRPNLITGVATTEATVAATLTRSRRVVGADHPHTLQSANNLANDLHALGQYEAARQLNHDNLTRRRQALGDDHPHTLLSASNLAANLWAMGQYETARQLGADTLTHRRRVLGEDHPLTLISAHSLASAHWGLGQYEAARQLCEKTLTRSRRVLGEDHPQTLASANDLANDLHMLGQYEQARQLDEDTLTRRRRVLGEDHPLTVHSAGNLAKDLHALGQYEAARQLNHDTLTRRRRVLGDDHPHTLTSASNLANDLRALGQDDQADQLEEWVQSRRGDSS